MAKDGEPEPQVRLTSTLAAEGPVGLPDDPDARIARVAFAVLAATFALCVLGCLGALSDEPIVQENTWKGIEEDIGRPPTVRLRDLVEEARLERRWAGFRYVFLDWDNDYWEGNWVANWSGPGWQLEAHSNRDWVGSGVYRNWLVGPIRLEHESITVGVKMSVIEVFGDWRACNFLHTVYFHEEARAAGLDEELRDRLASELYAQWTNCVPLREQSADTLVAGDVTWRRLDQDQRSAWLRENADWLFR